MKFSVTDAIFLEFPTFYIASSFEDNEFWSKVWGTERVHASDSAILISLDSASDGTDEDDLVVTLFSDSIELSEQGAFEPNLEGANLLFRGILSTPEGSFSYTDSDVIANDSEQISLQIYSRSDRELCILVDTLS